MCIRDSITLDGVIQTGGGLNEDKSAIGEKNLTRIGSQKIICNYLIN